MDPASGGPAEGILRQAEACSRAGLDVEREVVTLDVPGSPYLSSVPLTVHALGRAKRNSKNIAHRALDYYRYSPDLTPWLRNNLKNYDVSIVHGLWNYASFASSKTLPNSNMPYFVFPHGMMDPWFRRSAPVKHIGKQIFWLIAEGKLLSKARNVFFTSEEELRQSYKTFWGHNYTGRVVGYGTGGSPFDPERAKASFASSMPSIAGKPYFLFLSRIHPKKGADLLVEAFARVSDARPDLQLVIAGPDQVGIRQQLEERVQSLGLGDRIHWAGMVSGEQKWGAYAGAEAFVLPSHQENFGIVVAEALSCGVPVLISDKVNIWREVSNSKAGIVAPDTLAGTVDLMQTWNSFPPNIKAEMAVAARSLFEMSFNTENTGPALVRTIRSIA